VSREQWEKVPFSEVIDFQEGPGIMARDFRPEGVPLIRLKGLDAGGSLLAGCDFLDPKMVERRWSHFRLQEGDVLLSTSASLGRIAEVSTDGIGSIAYTGLIRMRPKGDRVFRPFIRYLLEGPDFQRQTEEMGVGSVIRHFGPSHLKQMTVRIPSIRDQRRIAEILRSLDEKIQLNRDASRLMENLVQALFKSWFVDFEPVRRNREEQLTAVPASLAGLSASAMGETNPQLKSETWRKAHFLDIADVARTQKKPYAEPAKVFSHYSIPAFDAGRIPSRQHGKDIRSSKFAVPQNAVLLCKLNPEIDRVWFLGQPEENAVCSTEFIVLVARPPFGQAYVYSLVSSTIFRSFLKGMVTGTSKSHQRVQPTSLAKIEIDVPPESLLRAYESLVRPILQRISNLRSEAKTLRTERDLLLPRLMAGEFQF
jgi:type I restriction enzyme, S subunit